jgi:hypothetical protein
MLARGRKSEDVATGELGDWIVQDGGIVVCSGCSSDSHKTAADPEAFSRAERVEKVPTSTARPRA